jgi:uncharacterized surface protein with fasciclin (FAS1) repeats
MQLHRRTLIAGAIAGLASITLSACGGGGDDAPPAVSLLETIQNDPQFSILSEAVLAAGMAGLLGGPAALTLFAPTNAAFVSFFAEFAISKEELLAGPLLVDILHYHLIDGALSIAALPLDTPIQTKLGGLNDIMIDADRVITDRLGRQSAVIAVDQSASNGVMHTVGTVFLHT